MGEFDATLGMGLMADDLAEEILKRADGSYEEASAALTEFAHGVQERLSELSKARHLVAELAVTDERFAEFGKRVAADMGAGDWSNTTRKHLGQAREHAKSFTTHDRVDLSPADFDEYADMAARWRRSHGRNAPSHSAPSSLGLGATVVSCCTIAIENNSH